MATINLSEIEDKYGAVVNKPAPQTDTTNLQSIADKYGATINEPAEPSVFAGTKQILGELKEDPLSLDVEPKKILSNAWETIKGSVSNLAETQTEWVESFGKTPGVSEEIGKTLEVAAATAGVIFSPISAFFEGANEIPVVGSVSKLVTSVFSGLGEGGAAIGDKAVDLLPIPQEAKDNIREGVKEIAALAAQIAVGGRLGKKVLGKKKTELTEKFGEKGADTIIGKATEVAEQKATIGKQKTEVVPEQVVAEKPAEVKPVEQIAEPIVERVGEIKETTTLPETKTGVETVAKAASDINTKIVEKGFKDLLPEEQAKFNSITIKDQLNKIANLMDTDLSRTIEMAAGKEKIPADINSQILFNSIAKKATADLDIGTLRRLADSPIASERSIAAQTLGAAGVERLIENDPIRAIREIEKIKVDAVKSRNKDIAKTSKAEVKKVKETIKKASAGKLADFIETLKC